MNKSTHNILNSKYTNVREHKNVSLKAWDHPHKISTAIYKTTCYTQALRNTSDPIHLSNKEIKQCGNLTSTKQLYKNFMGPLYNSLIQFCFILIIF
jgi:hypothetical protein